MQEIRCPKCGEVFQVDDSGYDQIAQQVRDREFEKELDRRKKDLDAKREQELEIIRLQEEKEHTASITQKDAEISEKDQKIAELQAKLDASETVKKLAVAEAVEQKNVELSQKVTEIANLKGELKSKDTESRLNEKSLQEQYEEKLKLKDEQIEYYKDFKARQSTKMIGESLEQHCLTQFNTIRMTAFPNAYFEKDNDAKTGSKGDFIYRECGEDGTEFISIMFEMKNEADETATKHKNEDFFKELDKDRNEKGCEYAILVSLLEIDNELYNNGIVDVSYKYPKMYVNAELRGGWKYYLDEAKQERSVEDQLAKLREEYKTIKPEEIKVIDPCMGSGHILVYAFDVLMQIYTSAGWDQREAAQSILKNNLYGLDIDDRAAQLAYFAVMMKARQYDRRLLTRGIQPNIYSIRESNGIQAMTIEYFHKNDPKLKADIERIVTEMVDAKEYGSILNVTPVDFAGLYARFDEIRNDINMMQMSALDELLPLVKCAEVLAQKYDVVVTNPPYMGYSGFDAKLVSFAKCNYSNSKSDMSTMFMEQTLRMCTPIGYMAMINIPVWMFITSYEQLRKEIITQRTIIDLLHPGRGIFGSDFGSVSFVIRSKLIRNYKAVYKYAASQHIFGV